MSGELEARLGVIEDYVGVDLSLALSVVDYPHPIEFVGSREAGYSVEPWVAAEGRPLGMGPTARTGVSLKGYSATPGNDLEPQSLVVPYVARWIAEDYQPGLWQGSGPDAFSFTTEGEAPALLNDDTAYTVDGHWISGTVVDFDGDEALQAPVPSASEIGFVIAGTFRRGTRLAEKYGILEMVREETQTDPNPYLGLRYTDDDRMQVWHQRTSITTALKVTPTDEMCVLGVWTSDDDDRVVMHMITGSQKVSRVTYTGSEVPTIAVGGQLYLGRSAGANFGMATMRLLDMVMVTDLEMFNAAVHGFSGFYIAERRHSAGT